MDKGLEELLARSQITPEEMQAIEDEAVADPEMGVVLNQLADIVRRFQAGERWSLAEQEGAFDKLRAIQERAFYTVRARYGRNGG